MKAVFNDNILAESNDIVYVDGNPYFPREAIYDQYFRDSRYTTVCGWKGKARYWDLIADDQIITNVAWSYETPKPDAEAIRYRVAFYSGKGIIISWWIWATFVFSKKWWPINLRLTGFNMY